jgi:hypothetical protein
MTIGFFWVAREWYSYCFSADSRQAQSLRQLYFATSVVESRDVSCCFDVVNAKKSRLPRHPWQAAYLVLWLHSDQQGLSEARPIDTDQSAYGVAVHQATLVPQIVGAAWQAQR